MKEVNYWMKTDNEETIKSLNILKDYGKKIVFTNGCYDLLHYGHVKYLEDASKYGILVIGVNTDESIKKIKGNNRPIIPQEHRIQLLLALRFVNYVLTFNEPTPINLIKLIKPDYLIKGSDWREDEIVGKDFVESYGGQVVRIDLVEGISTSKIIEKIKKCPSYTAETVRKLRYQTDVGLLMCKRALDRCDGDFDKAVEYIHKRGMCK